MILLRKQRASMRYHALLCLFLVLWLIAAQQSDTNFRATYLARYQHLADIGCGGPNANIQVFCHGTIAPISISSDTIQCSYVTDNNGWDGLNCVNTCNIDTTTTADESCEDLYLERDQIDNGGAFGEITYQCLGEQQIDVDSYMVYLGGEDGNCQEKSNRQDGSSDSRNYHVAQLGVQCPLITTTATELLQDSDSVVLHTYRFDDYHFECSIGTTVGKFDKRYTCWAGANCQGQECQVQYQDIKIYAESHNFHECIEALTDDVQVLSSPEQQSLLGSLQTESEPGSYLARFEAKWQLQLDKSSCSGEFATKRITCLNNTRIANVEPLFDNVNCTILDDNNGTVMECNDTTEDYFVNGFSGVQYDCIGSTLPETQVEYLSANSYCDTDTLVVDQHVGHFLQLGVICNVPLTTINVVSNLDTYFECGKDNDYDILDGVYTCQQINVFPHNSPKEDSEVAVAPVPLDVVMMRTDYRWSSIRPEICFDYTNGTFAPEPQEEEEEEDAPWWIDETPTPAPSDIEGDATITTKNPSPTISPTEAPPAILDIPVATNVPRPTIDDEDTTVAPTSQQSPSPSPLEELVIPPGTTYQVEYVARFQQVVSPGCINSNPAMVLTCLGEIRDVSTSHPSIECGVETLELDDGRDSLLCENTCAGEDCENVFLSSNQLGGTSAPFGEVYFTCFGETPMDTDGTFIIVEGGPGSCDGTDPSGASYNLKLAQMGVRCPQDDGSLDYVMDDYYGDCGVLNRAIKVDDQYTCFAGLACGKEPCLVSFEQLIVAADPHQFAHCIQSNNGSPIPALAAPDVPVREAGIYVATFQARWKFIINSSCIGSVSPKLITCTNGSIRLLEALGSGDTCAVTSQNSIECTDSAAEGGVTYECESSSAIPQTHVEYASGEARCDVANQVERHLQLGIQCGDPGSYSFGDVFLECGASNDFEIFNGGTYTCLSTLPIPASERTGYRIPAVEIFTDYRYPLHTPEVCYKYTPVRGRNLSQRGLGDNIEQLFKVSRRLTSATSSLTTSSTTALGLLAATLVALVARI